MPENLNNSVSWCLVLSSCLLQQLWLMKARKGQKHLWQTDQRNLKLDKPTGGTTTPTSWTELPRPRQTSLTGKSTSTNNSAFKAKKRRSPYKQVDAACETTTTTCLPLPLDQLLLILWGSIFPKIQFTTSYDAGAKAIHLTWISNEACVWLCHPSLVLGWLMGWSSHVNVLLLRKHCKRWPMSIFIVTLYWRVAVTMISGIFRYVISCTRGQSLNGYM